MIINEQFEKKIDNLIQVINQYDAESFAGFFAYFIKERPENITNKELKKFKSKLKDFYYLIALNIFSEKRGTVVFDFNPKLIGDLADMVNDIRSNYHIQNWEDYTMEAAIHEMAFRNYFDNGTLSYVEQDLEKIRSVFSPFQEKIVNFFGIDIDFFIEIYKGIELISKIKFDKIMAFTYSKEYGEFLSKIEAKQMEPSEAIRNLPNEIAEALLSFHNKNYGYLLFTKEDLYALFDEGKVNKFLEIFSCSVNNKHNYRYYTDKNPLTETPILEVSSNQYLHICQREIPNAIYKRIYTFLSNEGGIKDKLRKHREKILEKKVSTIFKSFFSEKSTFFYENYYVIDGYEQDLLILTKGVAIIVETKASKFREPLRDVQKAVVRLKDDFKDSIQVAYKQCRRVEDYFLKSEVFNILDAKGKIKHTINPSRYHSVFSIIVTLERFGCLQTDLELLLKKEKGEPFPWSVYIDDLETFLLTLKYHTRNSKSKFYTFLQSRGLLHGHMYAIDELDICGYYLKQPDKFAKFAKSNDTLCQFDVHEQEIFDTIYYTGGLRFNELPILNFKKYPGVKKSDLNSP